MTTLALPISELGPVVVKAKAETKRVVSYSKSETAKLSFGLAWETFSGVWHLRKRFSRLVEKQSILIEQLVERDLSLTSEAELADLAGRIENLLADERSILDLAGQLGAEIRVWWTSSLLKMAQQVEYLQSIADSLRISADDEVSTLLAMAAGQFASV